MKSSFLIVADRGNLKAYRVEKVPGDRPPRVALVQAFTFTDAHLKITDKLSDMAGRFPVGSAPAQSQGSHQMRPPSGRIWSSRPIGGSSRKSQTTSRPC
jgi:hypothetical protein